MSHDRMNETDDAALEALFAEARMAEADPVPEGLRARLLADAVPPVAKRSWWSRLGEMLADLGGAPGLVGVSTAGLAGVWIGFSGPGLTGDLVSQFWQGAATVSPTVSAWVEDGPLMAADGDLLAYISGEAE